ncbi:hypothetical protein COBT_003906, partial [Conglomerata obtusa]
NILKADSLIAQQYGQPNKIFIDYKIENNYQLAKLLCKVNKDLQKNILKERYFPIFEQNYYNNIKFTKETYVNISLRKVHVELLSFFDTVLLEVLVYDQPGSRCEKIISFFDVLRSSILDQSDNFTLYSFYGSWSTCLTPLLNALKKQKYDK